MMNINVTNDNNIGASDIGNARININNTVTDFMIVVFINIIIVISVLHFANKVIISKHTLIPMVLLLIANAIYSDCIIRISMPSYKAF